MLEHIHTDIKDAIIIPLSRQLLDQMPISNGHEILFCHCLQCLKSLIVVFLFFFVILLKLILSTVLNYQIH